MFYFLFIVTISAFAAPASPIIEDDGTVRMSMEIDASEADIRAILADTSGSLMDLSTEVLSVQSLPKGTCEDVKRETKGVWRPLKWRSLRCPTANGWHEELVTSDDFSAFETEWRLEAVDGGTIVTYRVRTELNMAIPQTVVRDGIVKGARNALVNLAKKVLRTEKR
jgi:hypothetical protein